MRVGQFNGNKTYLRLDELTTGLFDLRSPGADIRKVVDKFFGIRCPVSITEADIMPVNTIATFEFENECDLASQNISELAFCGKCSRADQKNLFNSLFIDIKFKYICFAYKVAKPITILYYTVIERATGKEFTLPLSVRTISDYR